MPTKKLYKENVYLSECESQVTKVLPTEVILDATVFFPEGGGQSSDIGTITRISDGAVFNVSHASEDGDFILHKIADTAAFTERKPCSKNVTLTEGDKVICRINWDHRFDNMQRHCGEHMLSGVMYKLFGGINRGFHMGEHFMTADISLEKDPSFTELTWDMAMDAEALVNSFIWQNLPVTTTEFKTEKEAEKMPLRKEISVDSDVSVVTIGDISSPADCVACCGTHPSTSAQVGLLKIYKIEKNKDMFRVYFDAGKRAMNDYRLKHDVITYLGNKYSAVAEDLVAKIEIQEEKHNKTKEELVKLKQKLISLKVDEIKKELENGHDFIVKFTDDLAPDDILRIGKPILSQIKKLVMIGDINTNTMILFSDGTVDCGKLVKENAGIYKGKGGGRKDNARALFPDRESMELFADMTEKLLR